MKNIHDKRKSQIDEIISIAKLASLLFSGIILFMYFYDDNNNMIAKNVQFFSIVSLELVILVLIVIFGMWIFAYKKKHDGNYTELFNWTENLIFIILFLVLITLTGGDVSEHKLLFLFIIITSTIQSGMKQGITIAAISSLMILTIDLINGSTQGVNRYFENDLILMGVFLITAWTLGYYNEVENEYKKELAYQANIDGLTEVYNHRYFHDSLKQEVDKAKILVYPLSIILMDIDYFKHYNDLHGHQAGDKVLKEIGEILRRNVRKGDIVARYGGEEFAIILPDTTELATMSIAERIRRDVERTEFFGEENQPNGKITASIGVSSYPSKAHNEVDLIKSADDALYRAKFFNKNRVESYYSILEELKEDIEAEHIDLITSIKTLISVINAKDRYTYGHTERVVMYSRLLGEKMGVSEEDMKTLKYGAYLHDIGKINTAKEILIKKMPLTNEEWESLKQHPACGVEIIKSVESLKNVIPLILHHHERFDGRGYPEGLKGEEIPKLARILTVVDSFDAMTSNRPYNTRKTYDDALVELERCKGGQFDPEIADAFIEVIKENGDNLDSI